MRNAENMDIRKGSDSATKEHRIRQGRIVIAGQYYNRHIRLGKKPGGAVENGSTQLIALERVSSQQNDIGSQRSRRRQHRFQSRSAPAVVDMNIGTVHQSRHAHTRSKSVRSVIGRR
jgi:hypothetical protein